MTTVQADELILLVFCVGMVVAFALGFSKGGQR